MLRPFTLEVHTVCRWTEDLILKSRTEIRFAGFWEDYYSLANNRSTQKFTYFFFLVILAASNIDWVVQ